MRLRAPLLLSLLLALQACTIVRDDAELEANIVRPGDFLAGSGVIQSVAVIWGSKLYRLSLHMDTGGLQTVDVDSNRFFEGQAVELTNDGRVVLVSGTSMNEYVRRGQR
jgi:hypothetical protein